MKIWPSPYFGRLCPPHMNCPQQTFDISIVVWCFIFLFKSLWSHCQRWWTSKCKKRKRNVFLPPLMDAHHRYWYHTITTHNTYHVCIVVSLHIKSKHAIGTRLLVRLFFVHYFFSLSFINIITNYLTYMSVVVHKHWFENRRFFILQISHAKTFKMRNNNKVRFICIT